VYYIIILLIFIC